MYIIRFVAISALHLRPSAGWFVVLALCRIVLLPILNNGLVPDMYTMQTPLNTDEQISASRTAIMENSVLRQKSMAPKTNWGINGLIAACNKNDRFKLLEDENIAPGNLDNPIHAVFSKLDCEGPMKQTLRLASHFLTHDTLLSFFVPLLYGHELRGVVDGKLKTFMTNPLVGVSADKYRTYLFGVRSALESLSHSLSFHFEPPTKRTYARTLLVEKPSIEHALQKNEKILHDTTCVTSSQQENFVKVELAEYFQNYYTSGKYAAASRCAQFRHDFLFATTLVHEIVHAVGIIRRGNLNEPYIRADCPETEWGYGWEHFVFGCIINPQDKSKPGTHLLMRKAWADQRRTDEAGGKEYSDVSMSYIAQWFRKETWDMVCEQGPTAIAPPVVHFKIQSSDKLGAWVIHSDHRAVKKDLRELYAKWKEGVRETYKASSSPSTPKGRAQVPKMKWKFVDTKRLQKYNIPTPSRAPKSSRYCPSCYLNRSESQPAGCKYLQKEFISKQKDAQVQSTSSNCATSRKRKADSREDPSPTKKARRV